MANNIVNKKYNKKSDFIQFVVGLIVYAVVLMIAEYLLNYTVKPVLIYWTLPLSILSFGIAYPIVNMIILKLCDILMGSAFNIHGFFATFFIAIFISFMRILLDNIITKNVGRG